MATPTTQRCHFRICGQNEVIGSVHNRSGRVEQELVGLDCFVNPDDGGVLGDELRDIATEIRQSACSTQLPCKNVLHDIVKIVPSQEALTIVRDGLERGLPHVTQ
jgi:hypothetical protein